MKQRDFLSKRVEPCATEPRLDAPAPVPRLELFVTCEAGRVGDRCVVLDGDVFRVGTHASNELVLADPHVSGFHCQLRSTQGGWRIEDTGSRNGTFVGGVRVRDADLTLPECCLDLGQSRVRVRALEGVDGVVGAPTYTLGAMYGSTPVMRRLFERIIRIAKANADVLIGGENGTGKELVAAEIVGRSSRAREPLVIVDCGALAHTLIESELFGHAKGAFTGAEQDRLGAFEAAEGGTVFLDEVGELPLALQPRLLRALAAREVRRMGENHTRKFNVRVIAATNRRLEHEVNQGRFREDLYFRLSVLRVDLPPLRDRLDDLPLLIGQALDAHGVPEKLSLFTPDMIEQMRHHTWPGNVRELKNYVERFVIFEDKTMPQAAPLADSTTRQSSTLKPIDAGNWLGFRDAKDRVIIDFEVAYLSALMKWAGGNVSLASRRSKIDRMYLHRLLQRHGLRRAAPLEG